MSVIRLPHNLPPPNTEMTPAMRQDIAHCYRGIVEETDREGKANNTGVFCLYILRLEQEAMLELKRNEASSDT